MKKCLFTAISIVLISACVFAANFNNLKPELVTTYHSEISGNAKPTDDTTNYKCDLVNLQRDTIYYNNHHKFGDTINVYTACIKEYPKKEYLYNNRGNIYKMLKQYDKAMADYDKAISLDSNYISPLVGKMSIYLMTTKFDDALSTSDKILKIDPKVDSVYYQRGIIYEVKNDYDNALKNYNLAIKYEPKRNPAAYHYRGNIYFKKEDFKSAIKDYKKSLDCYKNAAKNNVALIDYSAGDVYHDLGVAYVKVEDYEKALACLYGATKYYEKAGNKKSLKETEKYLIEVYDYYQSIKKK